MGYRCVALVFVPSSLRTRTSQTGQVHRKDDDRSSSSQFENVQLAFEKCPSFDRAFENHTATQLNIFCSDNIPACIQ